MNEDLYRHFLNAGAMVMQREKYNNEIKKHRAKISDKNAEVGYLKAHIDDDPKPYSVKTGWATALFIISGFTTIASLGLLGGATEGLTPDEVLLTACVVVGIISATHLLVAVCLLVSAIKNKKASVIANTRKHELAQRECEIFTAQEEKEIARIEAESKKFWATYKSLIDFLPEKYQALEAVAFMLDAIKNLRAHTLTDVINLWEAYVEHVATIQAVKQMKNEQKRQNARIMSALADVQENQAALHADLKTVKTLQVIDILQNS